MALYFGPSQILDSNGDPISGAKLNVYQSGTSTPTTIYADVGLGTPLPNPLIADSGGYLSAFYTAIENVKFVLTNAQDVEIYSVDPAAGTPLAQQTSGIEDVATVTQIRVADDDTRIRPKLLVGDLAEQAKGYLHVLRGLALPPGTRQPPTIADGIAIEGDQATGMTIITPDANPGAIVHSVPSKDNLARIQFDYNAGNQSISFFLDATEVLKLQGGPFVEVDPSIPKAWVFFDGTNVTNIMASYNVSSITLNGTADYTVNFTKPFKTAGQYSASGFCISGNAPNDGDSTNLHSLGAMLTTSCRIFVTRRGDVPTPSTGVCAIFHGELA